MAETDTYIAIRPTCGHVVGCVVDEPAHQADTFKNLAQWSKDGYQIDRVASADIRSGAVKLCPADCPERPKARRRRR